jgi:hypothetical protein
MPIPPFVPEEPTHGPFTLADAERAGLSRRQLQGKAWRRLATGRYIWATLPNDPVHLLQAIHPGLPSRAAFSGQTADVYRRPDVVIDQVRTALYVK